MATKVKKRSQAAKKDVKELFSAGKDQFLKLEANFAIPSSPKIAPTSLGLKSYHEYLDAHVAKLGAIPKGSIINIDGYQQLNKVPTPPFTPHHIQAAMANVEKPEAASGGPFTIEIIHALNKQVNDIFDNEWAYLSPSEGTVNYFNQAFQNGGFESIDKWWSDESNEVGFFQMFWSKGELWRHMVKGSHEHIIEHLKIWFEAYQQFIRENGNFTPPKPKVPRQTQKAKGIERLLSFAGRFSANTLPHLFLGNEEVRKLANGDKLDWFWEQISAYRQNEKVFARCCPMNPRHGFTDSIFINACDEDTFRFQIGTLCKKMLADDENGELIIMRPCFATWNAVINDKSIVLGKNHDGATGGKDTFTFPISKPFPFAQSEKTSIGIDENHSVFSEFVGIVDKNRKYGNGASSHGGLEVEARYLTQLRGGPKIDITGDFVPRKVVLDRDFLIPHCKEDGTEYRDTEWEKVIEDVKARKDWDKYFVLHKGGSISSHFGVHCFINEIPYIVSDVKLGKKETLEPNATKRMAWNAGAFRTGFEKSPELLKLIKDVDGVNILLAALHNYPALDLSDPKQAEFFGFSCGFAVYLSIATCLGEFRYGRRLGREQMLCISHEELSREDVYNRVLVSDFNYSLRKAFRKCRLFGVPRWRGSVGGLKWLECSEAAFDLWNACCVFVEKGTKESLGNVASKLNKTVNVCHNNGKMLTKFGGDFDLGESRPQQIAFKVAPVVFELLNSDVMKTRIDFTQVELDPQIWSVSEIVKRRSYKKYSSGKVVLTGEEKPTWCDNKDGKNGKLCSYAGCPACYCQAIKQNTPCPREKWKSGCLWSHNIPQAASEEPDNAKYEDENENECDCGEHDCSKCTPEGYVENCNCFKCAHNDELPAAKDCTDNSGDCEEEHCCCDSCSD